MNNNNNKSLVFVTFARANIKSKNNFFNLFVSICRINMSFNFDEDFPIDLFKILNKNVNIVYISKNILTNKHNRYQIGNTSYFLNIYQISLVWFFIGIFTNYVDLNFFHYFFKDKKDKDFHYLNEFDPNPLFIFEDLDWKNLVSFFRLSKIYISGGSITNRHKLSVLQSNLFLYVFILCKGSMETTISQIKGSYFNKSLNSFTIKDSKDYFSKYDILDTDFNNSINADTNLSEIWGLLEEDPLIDFGRRNIILKNILSNLRIHLDLLNTITKKKKELDDLTVIKKNIESYDDYNNSIECEIFPNFENNQKIKLNKVINLSKDLSNEILSLEESFSYYNNYLSNLEKREKPIYKWLHENLNSFKHWFIPIFKDQKRFYSTQNTKTILNIRKYSTYQFSNQINEFKSTENKFSINSPLYMELMRILNTEPLNKETQLKIELYLENLGLTLLNFNLNKKLDLNYVKINPLITNIIYSKYEPLKNQMENYISNLSKQNFDNDLEAKTLFYKRQKLIFNLLEIDEILGRCLGRLLRIISNNGLSNKNTHTTTVSIDLGGDLIRSSLISLYKIYTKESKEEIYLSLSQFIEKDHVNVFNDLQKDDEFKLKLGAILIDMLMNVDLIKFHLISEGTQKQNIIICSGELENIVSKKPVLMELSAKIPMIVKPNFYIKKTGDQKEKLGGYLLNDNRDITPLIIQNPELKKQSIIEDENLVYKLVNYVSSVGFKINKNVLNFVIQNGVELSLVEDPYFIHPLTIKQDELKLKGKKLNKNEFSLLTSYNSKKLLEMNILGLAQIFENVPEFYIPVRLDNRGRLYCLADYLNYQSIELAKALLVFSKSELIKKSDETAINALKIYGANCYGKNKLSNLERIAWTDSNHEKILNFRNFELIREAKNKLLFIAFCFEYEKYDQSNKHSDKDFYMSNFPIQLDATCNGFQHIALLSGDILFAKELNLNSANDTDIPKDFYNYIALKLSDYFKAKYNELKQMELESDSLICEIELLRYKKLSNLNITRELVKPIIMVEPYNASILSQRDYLEEEFLINYENSTIKTKDIKNIKFKQKLETKKIEELNITIKYYKDKDNLDLILDEKDLLLLTSTIKKIIYTEFGKIKELKKYLSKIASICNKLKLAIPWLLPNGLKIMQQYLNTTSIRLKPFTFRKNTFIIVKTNDEINNRKQIRALMPNLIHSLDSSSLALLVNLFFNYSTDELKINNFYSIHDCFAVTAKNVSTLINLLQLVYIKIYCEEQYLRRFHEGILNSIKQQYGEECFNKETNEITIDSNFDNKTSKIVLKFPNIEVLLKGPIASIEIAKAGYIVN